MKKGRVFYLAFALLILINAIPLAYAKTDYHMTILAVKETSRGLEGSTADLYLDIVPGKGRVFIESYPLTKIDTQMSTRFAKEIACDYANVDCSDYDFFYAIKSESPVIGGPSAGAAISTLTIAALLGEEVKEDTAITGTINSGGLIGHISGLRQKVEAAPDANITTVLIPSRQNMIKEMNLSWNLTEYAEPLGVKVIEVTDIDEAVSIFTGRQIKERKNISISKDYEKIMELLALKLCNKTNELKKETINAKHDNETEQLEKNAVNLTKKSEEAVKSKLFYSAASYCFGANVKYRTILIGSEKTAEFNSTRELIEKMNKNLDKIPVKTITDLETYMVVKERLKDAETSLKKAEENYPDEKWVDEIAYAIERIYSAESWAKFFGADGNEFRFDNETIKKSCINKIGEAEERKQYVDLIFLNNEKEEGAIEHAMEYLESEDFELCLYDASKAKAEADAIISLIGIDEEEIGGLVEDKLEAVKNVIAKQEEKGNFPIVGYSYYEYANSLAKEDRVSALIYAEYALELSNLDLYFEEKHKNFRINIRKENVFTFAMGMIIGIMIMILIKTLKKNFSNK